MNDADRLELPTCGPEGLDRTWDEVGHELTLPGFGTRTMYDYYDRQGNPISMRDWTRLSTWDARENGYAYKVVARDEIGTYLVSTIWLGLNHAFMPGPPLIFETMVFADEDWSGAEQLRYSTEEEARAGHARLVEEVRLFADLAMG